MFLYVYAPKVSLQPGRGISEHLHYCMALAREQRWFDALLEIGSIQADLSVFPFLAELAWTNRHESEVDEAANRVGELVSLIESGVEQNVEANSQICKLPILAFVGLL